MSGCLVVEGFLCSGIFLMNILLVLGCRRLVIMWMEVVLLVLLGLRNV